MKRSAGARPRSSSAGSRRAALLKQGPKAARLKATDVDRLRANRSVEARINLAAKFGRQFEQLASGETRTLAHAVLELLVKDVQRRVRQALAETIAYSPSLPRATANMLARDHIEVASPVLERSPVLGDNDLMDIVRTHAVTYALSVAVRARLSEPLSEALAELGGVEVARRLAGNTGAELSQKAIRRILDRFGDDGEVRKRLIARPAVPYELVDEIDDRLE